MELVYLIELFCFTSTNTINFVQKAIQHWFKVERSSYSDMKKKKTNRIWKNVGSFHDGYNLNLPKFN